jgi:hypothetical protein
MRFQIPETGLKTLIQLGWSYSSAEVSASTWLTRSMWR